MTKSDVGALGPPTDDDAMRLALAFYCILEPELRASVLSLAVHLATTSQRMDGHTHFNDLDCTQEPENSSH
jgi:hypothetical protein